jgi:hypothetical protein
MRDFDWKFVPVKGLVLLTVQEISIHSPVFIADHRDTHALAYTPTGGFIGQSLRNGMRLGKVPLRLIDGIWYMAEDEDSQRSHTAIQLSPDLLTLRVIP